MPTEMSATTTEPAQTNQAPPVVALKQTPLKAQMPTEEEVEIAEVFAPPPDQPTDQPTQTSARLPETLPKTGSSLPLVGLIGLLSLGAAGLLRRASAN